MATPQTMTQPKGTLVTLSGINKTFWRGKEPVHVLDGLNLEIPAGSFEALMGPSGSGKSTLLNLIAGLDKPTAGTVSVAGQTISSMSESELAK
ncbi:MAG TPA: ATP-binding cassette domain-containing protein, partial [bacterium]|nr:ATP-binding cassette domain-containing protein [bacterium]